MFGLEVNASAVDSQEDNGKEREKKERFMDVCVPSQVVGTYGGAKVCVCMSVRLLTCVGEAMCAQSMCVYWSLYLQMLARLHASF